MATRKKAQVSKKATTKQKTSSRRPSSRSAGKVRVDFTGVEGSFRCADGDYPVKVSSVEKRKSDEGNDYLYWKLKVTSEEEKGSTLIHITSLQKQALWNLRNTLEAAEMEVPDGALDLVLADLSDLEFGVTVENETYQGNRRPHVVGTFPLSDFDEGEGNGDGEEGEGEEADGEEGEYEFSVDDEVIFESDGEDWYGTITAINEEGETADVQVDDDVYEIALADLRPNEEAEV